MEYSEGKAALPYLYWPSTPESMPARRREEVAYKMLETGLAQVFGNACINTAWMNAQKTLCSVTRIFVQSRKEWKYLYRAVDSSGQTIVFMPSARRDVSAAKRFFKKLMRADHRRLPFTIGTDKHASYPEAFASSVKEKVLPFDCKLRRVKYLNNLIEQDHRAIRRRWRAMQCFRSFHTAERTIEGIEAMHVMRKGREKD